MIDTEEPVGSIVSRPCSIEGGGGGADGVMDLGVPAKDGLRLGADALGARADPGATDEAVGIATRGVPGPRLSTAREASGGAGEGGSTCGTGGTKPPAAAGSSCMPGLELERTRAAVAPGCVGVTRWDDRALSGGSRLERGGPGSASFAGTRSFGGRLEDVGVTVSASRHDGPSSRPGAEQRCELERQGLGT